MGSYSRAGQHVAAFKALHHAQELRLDDRMCTYLSGDVRRQTGLFQDAIASFRSVLQVQPNGPGALTSLARTQVDLGLSLRASTGFMSRAQGSFVTFTPEVSFQYLDNNTSFHSFAWKIIADTTYCLSCASSFTD